MKKRKGPKIKSVTPTRLIISRHLPVAVQTERTKQKRFFRFIDSKFPKQQVLDRWARFVIETVYQTSGAVVPILIDETALIGPFQLIAQTIKHEYLHIDDDATVIELRRHQLLQQRRTVVQETRIAFEKRFNRIRRDNIGVQGLNAV